QKTALAVAAGAAATLATTAFVQSGPAAQAPERSSVQLRGRAAAQSSATGSSAPGLVGCTAAATASALLASQLRGKAQSRKSQVVVSAFENELGVQAPFGFWDPIGFTADGDIDAFKRRRATELKHGRIAMLATMGFMTP
ncbi:FCPA, partial [Symbiodinium microadriaticum]